MKSIISVSAWRDISYAIQLYEDKCVGDELIILTQSRSIYDYIKSLELGNTSILLFEVVQQPLFFRLFFDYFRLRFFLGRIPRDVHGIYFFTNYFDYVSFFLLSKFPDSVEKKFIDHYNIKREKTVRLPAVLKAKLAVYRILGNSTLGLSQDGFIPIFDLPASVEVLKPSPVPESTLLKYQQSPETESRVLLVAGGDEADDTVLNEFLHQLQDREFRVDLKPHPRRSSLAFSTTGGSKVHILNAVIPFELMMTKQYDVVLGCRSASLASSTDGQRSVSLLYLMSTLTEEEKCRYRDYLCSLNDSIVFPQCWTDVWCILSHPFGMKSI